MKQTVLFSKLCSMRYKYYLLALVVLTACGRDKPVQPFSDRGRTNNNIRYADRFAIAVKDSVTYVYLMGKRNSNDTTSIFALSRDSSLLTGLPAEVVGIRIPCKKIAALSSIYYSMFCELGSAASIAAIDNIDYVNNSEILEKFRQGKIKELMRNPEIDVERTIQLGPDIIFMFGMGITNDEVPEKLKRSRLPVAVSVDHLETSPLARAEWIKFFACFADKKHQADSIFSAVETNYKKLKEEGIKKTSHPTVFTEVKLGDTWYMPGGRSYVAQLIEDAGGDYLWRDDASFGSIPLSFEQVLSKAENADYWINLSMVRSRANLLEMEPRYSRFRAYKEDHLFNNTRVVNANGYSTYWESGMIYPDRILSDLLDIFHGEPDKEKMNYYIQLK
jgi:iron complex transport system substrate-binding protein